jgi:phage terminase large subunit-like protein
MNWRRQLTLKAILFDRWGATKIIQDIESRGMTVIEFGQGFASMSPPTKEIEKLILERRIIFKENPALRWCFLKRYLRIGCSREPEAIQKAQPGKNRYGGGFDHGA